MIVWTILCAMLYCEKTSPLLAIPVDDGEELIYSGMTEHTVDNKVIEDDEV